VVGALVFGRRLRRVPARRLLLADSVVRAVFIGAVPLAWLAGLLTLPLYVGLLAVSSLLHAWGTAGKYTLLAELLPDEQRLAANTLVGSLTFAGTIAGPAIAGVLVTHVSAALVLGLDALTYVFLAVLVARMRLPESGHVSLVDQAAARGGLGLLRSHPGLPALLTLTWFFNLLYGPVEVALPLHVTDDLHAPGTLLRRLLDAVRHRRGARRARGRRATAVATLAGDGCHRGRLGARAAAVRVRRADGRRRCMLHARRRDLRTVCSALRDADADEVATAAPGREVRSPQRGAAHRLPLGTGLGGPLTTALGQRATLGGSGLATPGARRRRVRRAASPTQEGSEPEGLAPERAASIGGRVSLQPDPDLVLFARVRLRPPAPARPHHGRHDGRINGQSFLAFIVLSADPKPYDSR